MAAGHFFDLMQQGQKLEAQNKIAEALQIYHVAASVVPGHAAPETKISTLTARQLWGQSCKPRAAAANGAPRVTMSTLGQNGRFGNQIFQYAYLHFYGEACGGQVETGDWIGRDMFGLDDPLVTRPPPRLQEGSFDAAAMLLPNARPRVNVDLVGYFQLPTAAFRLRRSKFRALFTLRGRAQDVVTEAWQKIGGDRRPVVALHFRRADFGYGRFWVAPSCWYARWLDLVWGKWSDPVLYIATDDPSVLDTFRSYDPVHSGTVNALPPDLRFILDFAILARSDALAIANSSFSFTAAMLNERAKLFVRPNPCSRRLEAFDPWDSQCLLEPPWHEPFMTPADKYIITTFISKGAVVFDVGAAVGNWSRAVQAALLGRVKIFAFESDPAYRERLRQWAELTRPDAITVIPGIDDDPRKLDDAQQDNPSDAISVCSGGNTIDEFCQAQGIRDVNFLRCGLAGDTLTLLRGSITLLSHARVAFIQFDYGGASRGTGSRLADIFALLSGYGYELFKVESRLSKVSCWNNDLEDYRPATYLAMQSRLTRLFGIGPSAAEASGGNKP